MGSINQAGDAGIREQDMVIFRQEAVERMGDEDIYTEIAHYFANHLEESLIALGKALDEHDLETCGRMAHSLKGNCATVGAEAMREQCQSLEKLCRQGNLAAAQSLFAGLAPKMRALRERILAA